jgi:DNA-binding transcriptional regulator YhcF (GntR family)
VQIAVDPASPVPPFEQVQRRLEALIADGTLPPEHRLPTVRALAAELGLAVNTVARAYRELETDGVTTTEGRRGTFIASSAVGTSVDATRAAADYVATARHLGLTLPEAVRLVEQSWTP